MKDTIQNSAQTSQTTAVERLRPGDLIKIAVAHQPGHDARISHEWHALVLLASNPDDPARVLRVAPIGWATEMATDLDVICPASAGPFGKPFLIEVWNSRPQLEVEAVEVVGHLEAAHFSNVCMAHNAMLGLGEDSSLPEGSVGLPIESEDDPRYEHSRERMREADRFSGATGRYLFTQLGAA